MQATTMKDNLEAQTKIEAVLQEKKRKYTKDESKVVEGGIEYNISGQEDLFLGIALMAAGASTYTR